MKKAFNLKGYIFGCLRKIYRWYPPRKEALVLAQRGKEYECAACKGLFNSKLVHIDHIQPVIDPINGFVGFDSYIERLFCDVSNLQVLCIYCHKGKTKIENKTRTIKKKEKKKNV